ARGHSAGQRVRACPARSSGHARAMRKNLLRAAGAALLLSGAHAAIDLGGIDPAVKPQDDFYRFANGNWLKTATLPADQARWGGFNELIERNWENVRAICERAAAKTSGATAVERLVGDFYASGMDEQKINAAGLSALEPELQRLAEIK